MPKNLLPPKIEEPGLLVGYSLEEQHKKTPFGFSFGNDDFTPQNGFLDPYIFHGEGHLITIAPTGAGKGVACVIPAALRHQGDLVIIDPKGENFAVTAARRNELGQDICLIDPFGVVSSMPVEGCEAGGINVFDLLPYLADSDPTSAQALAGMLMQSSRGGSADPFWDMSATSILAGLIDFYANDPDGGTIHDLLDDLFCFPQERNSLVSKQSPLEKRVEENAEFQQVISRFSLHPWQVEEAYRQHQALQSGELTTSHVITAVQQELMCDNETDALFGFTDKEVEIANQDFATAIRSFCASDPDDRTMEILLAEARASFPAAFQQASIQKRVKRFLSAGDTYDISYPVAILRMMSSRRDLTERVSAMISGTPDKTWGSMITVLHNGLGYLNSAGIRKTISNSSLDLDKFREGVGTSVYLVFPPHRLATHSQLLSTLFKGLINVLVTRKSRPEKSTLFLMDEVAQLGYVDEFVAAKTLLRGYGVQVWSFWQDLSQLQTAYPNVWPTIINNCKVFQAFGCATPMMANAMEDIFMVPASTVLDLEKDEMLLSVYGDEPVIARKPIYYSDPAFSGIFSTNPMIQTTPFVSKPEPQPDRTIEEKQVRQFSVEIRRKKKLLKDAKA
ncbi:TraM recognition domain-containing protein [Sulfitobacter sp. M39]|uniref:type IV secretory system conjugative DNA transfer family protein n=1 Tax=Sulfitobacter sp. M39 TaxID=2675334 RepID=UPI001F008FC9|nr:type IV secretory system conjugative DNA transfer family protein [Sulfitobacter sp. M39]MCF7747102.1 TraM recognition domain-containing protein [Sulfitobacter sp. M39]